MSPSKKETENHVEYAYLRVSSKDQNEARQIDAVKEFGIKDKNIYLDKISGKDFNRPAYKKFMRKLKEGDAIIIKSIDRLGRNYAEIIEQWNFITKNIKADIVVLDMPLLDTRAKQRDLTGILISDIVLQVLSYVAETERASIRQRQAEGIAAAKARGVRLGHEPMKIPEGFEKYRLKYRNGEITLRNAGKHFKVSHSTFYRWCRQIETSMGIKTETKTKNSVEKPNNNSKEKCE